MTTIASVPEISNGSASKDRQKTIWIVSVAAVLALLIGGYVAAAWILRGTVPKGTSVLGVEIGGLDADQAQQKLERDLQSQVEASLPVALNEVEAEIDPAESGLLFDAEGTVDKLVGFSLSPARLWHHISGSSEASPVVDVDEEALELHISAIAPDLALPPVDGTIQFVGGAVETTLAEQGSEIDIPGAVNEVSKQWLTGPRPLSLPAVEIEPEIDDDEVNRALEEDANPLIEAPLTVEVGDQQAVLEPLTLADAATFVPEDSRLRLDLDGALLADSIREQLADIENAPVNATVTLNAGVPEVTPSQPGSEVDHEFLVDDVIAASHTDQRAVQVEFVEVEPELTTADAEALNIRERISTFSTYLTADAVRTENLRVGASKINGDLVLPGETYSLLDALSPITVENGYGAAGILVDGALVDGIGGGLSQLATTFYNAVFFSGLEDVEHTPHSQYFARYPEVREATIYVPYIDLKFRNNSDYGVLIESWVSEGQLHVAFWSTKVWDIQAVHSGRSQIVQPSSITSNVQGCVPKPAGQPGFFASVDRQFYKEGEWVKTETYSWRYEPENAVRCA